MNSKFAPKYRAATHLLGALLAIGVIIWAESDVWRSVNYLRQQSESGASERFHLSGQLEGKIRALNLDLLHYSLKASPELKAIIEKESELLRTWLPDHRDLRSTLPQRALLDEAEAIYERYAAHARLLMQTNQTQLALPAWRAQKETLLGEMLALIGTLSLAERTALSELMEQTQSSMEMIHRKLIFSSLVLVAMGAILGTLAYRGFVTPLRSRLLQSQRVVERQEKLSSLGVVAAGVAHEIRNPLTSIKARLFTQQSLLDAKSEALEDNVFIAEEISRLEKIVADFLAFARPSDPQMIVLKATQPFRDLDGLIRPVLSAANIQLKTEFLADPLIKADSAQLRQVLINLVQNAGESIGRDGTITLRTRTRTRKLGRFSGSTTVAVLEVEDTGPGIPPDVAKRLFDPFFTTKASGTGLGLSIAARILEKHGGTLEYQTEPNRGTIFRLVLPIAASET